MNIKFQQTNIQLSQNVNINANLSCVFTFQEGIFGLGKNKFPQLKATGLIDLISAGAAELTTYNEKAVLLVSLGEKEKFSLSNYFKAIKSLSNILANKSKSANVDIILEDELAKLLDLSADSYYEQSLFHTLNFMYYFDENKSEKKSLTLSSLNIVTNATTKECVGIVCDLLEGVFLVKHLGNNPANIVTPSYLAKTAESFKAISDKVTATILDKDAVKKLNMNAFLAVANGSNEPAKLIQLQYAGADKNKKPIVLVGKGITFDSGGISLKPGGGMDYMKFDMCGGAAVLGVFLSVVKLNLPINLTVVVPSCENMPSGSAVKPGDVVRTMSGKTVEIQNTDAEGRLILCDALTYVKQFDPEFVIDLATLTGACIIALGKETGGLYSNDNILADALIKSGIKTNDRVWRMPLFAEYHEMLKGTVADLSNIGSWKGEAGSVTAACFLEEFVDYKWAHLDIAGVAWGKSSFNAEGYTLATGRPFYLLMNFLRQHATTSKQ